MKARIKMHQVLISVLLVFVSIMVITTLFNLAKDEMGKTKSEKSKVVLLQELHPVVQSYIDQQKLDLNVEQISAADFFFFKNKREVAVILKTGEKDHLLRTSFKNLSPGYGIREKIYELTPPEGVYSIELPGFQSKVGYFVKLQYPPESYKNYQRLTFEELKNDPILISEKVQSASFIQADTDLMKLLVYVSANLEASKTRLLIYPDRPPLSMEIGGTEFIAKIYLNLEEEYKKLNDLIESSKPKL